MNHEEKRNESDLARFCSRLYSDVDDDYEKKHDHVNFECIFIIINGQRFLNSPKESSLCLFFTYIIRRRQKHKLSQFFFFCHHFLDLSSSSSCSPYDMVFFFARRKLNLHVDKAKINLHKFQRE